MTWHNRKKQEAQNKIDRWMKRYEGFLQIHLVRFLVYDALLDTRSPGKKEVYKAWLEENKGG